MNFEEFFPATLEGVAQTCILDFSFKPSSCIGTFDIWCEEPIEGANDFREFIKHLGKRILPTNIRRKCSESVLRYLLKDDAPDS